MNSNHFLLLSMVAAIYGCQQSEHPAEDVKLFEIVAVEQLHKNNDFVNSMRAQLEFYGAQSDEADFYQNSRDIVKLRNEIMQNGLSVGIVDFADSVDHLYDNYKNGSSYSGIHDQWSEELECIKEAYKRQLDHQFDSATYYKFIYTTLKKEHALHMFNAQRMGH